MAMSIWVKDRGTPLTSLREEGPWNQQSQTWVCATGGVITGDTRSLGWGPCCPSPMGATGHSEWRSWRWTFARHACVPAPPPLPLHSPGSASCCWLSSQWRLWRTSGPQRVRWASGWGTVGHGIHNSASGWRGPVRKAGVYSQQSQEAGLVLMVSALASDGDRVHEGGR